MNRVFKRVVVCLVTLAVATGNLPLSNVFRIQAQAAPDDFTTITTAEELDTVVRQNLSGNYQLGGDIDLSEYAYNNGSWTASSGWKGIGGSLASAFKGTLDGNGYTISGLWSKDRGDNQGLFGWLSGATIENLTIELAPQGITGYGERKGGLAGNAYGGTVIENSRVVGSAQGSPITGAANYIGGFVGIVNGSQIRSSSATGVNAKGGSYVGGFTGGIYGASTITDAYATGTATSTASYAGGFAGGIYEGSTVEHSYAAGDVYGQGSYVGGFTAVLYGAAPSHMFRTFAFGNVKSDSAYAGGLIGSLYDKSTVEESAAYGNVSAKLYTAGGLIGEVNQGTIKNAYAQGNVTSTTGTGGLVGYLSAAVSGGGNNIVANAYSSGTVSGSAIGDSLGAFSGLTATKFGGTNYHDKTKTQGIPSFGTVIQPINLDGNSLPQGKDTATMMKQATFIGWNFTDIWGIDENETYPYFIWMPGTMGVAPEVSKSSANITSTDEKTNVNDTLTYTITAANTGKLSWWDSVTVTDTLPLGVTFVPESVQVGDTITPYTYDKTTRTLKVSLGNITVNTTKVLTFQATVNPDAYGMTIKNTATVNGKDSKVGNNVDKEVTEPGTGQVVEKKKTRDISGLISPAVFDDLLHGEAFLDAASIDVSLRETFNSEPLSTLTVKATVTDNQVAGFTIKDVPFGSYILTITRPGYLTRSLPVVVAETDPLQVQLAPPDGDTFVLWAGDSNMDWIVDISDLMVVTNLLGETWGSAEFDAHADFNGDGVIDQADVNLAVVQLGRSIANYQGAGGINFGE